MTKTLALFAKFAGNKHEKRKKRLNAGAGKGWR